jgi:hypothetical protein
MNETHKIFMWISLGSQVSSTNKTDRHDITEMLLKVVLNTITPPRYLHGLLDQGSVDTNFTVYYNISKDKQPSTSR